MLHSILCFCSCKQNTIVLGQGRKMPPCTFLIPSEPPLCPQHSYGHSTAIASQTRLECNTFHSPLQLQTYFLLLSHMQVQTWHRHCNPNQDGSSRAWKQGLGGKSWDPWMTPWLKWGCRFNLGLGLWHCKVQSALYEPFITLWPRCSWLAFRRRYQ